MEPEAQQLIVESLNVNYVDTEVRGPGAAGAGTERKKVCT